MRAMIFQIHDSAMYEILVGRKALVLPDGATIARSWIDLDYEDTVLVGQSFCFRVEHQSYAVVEPGRKIPIAAPEFRDCAPLIEPKIERKPADRESRTATNRRSAHA